jgi:hypothetical protein
MWNDAKFRTLPDRGRLAFIFVLTHPHLTALGAMRATYAGLAAELGWPPGTFRKALGEAVRLGMVEVSEAAAYIGLPRFLRYNEPEGPNSVRKAWPAALDLIPECAEKRRLIARCAEYLDGKSDAFRDAIGDALRHAFAMPSPIQEQEQEREQEQKLHSPVDGEAVSSPQDLADLWNTVIPKPKVAALKSTRLRHAKARLHEHPDLAWWRTVIERIARTPFLTGASPHKWRANFDWLVANELNAEKVLEGVYGDDVGLGDTPPPPPPDLPDIPEEERTRNMDRLAEAARKIGERVGMPP